MRAAIKFSVAYLLAFIAAVALAVVVLPEQLIVSRDYWLTGLFAVVFFLVLPVLYWFWVIRVGEKKAWRLLIAISLSCLAARYSFPDDIASYFEFVAWLRYPFIAILVVLELFIVVSIVRSLWGARRLGGDPRINVLKEYKEKPAVQLDLALLLSYELAFWYYAIPFFSRKHIKPLANLKLRSAHKWFLLSAILVLLIATVVSYMLLVPLNELLATVVASLWFYAIIYSFANYRISRYYSLYVSGDTLVINSNILNILAIDVRNIASIAEGEWARDSVSDDLYLGSAENANIEIRFRSSQTYYSLMGVVTEKIDKVRLCLTDASDVECLLALTQVGPATQ